jgi:hypothetical protein
LVISAYSLNAILRAGLAAHDQRPAFTCADHFDHSSSASISRRRPISSRASIGE